MQVQWSYEGVSFRHTAEEVDDPECHTWQGPVAMDELIVHAANLHLFKSAAARPLWSVRGGVPFEEPKRVAA